MLKCPVCKRSWIQEYGWTTNLDGSTSPIMWLCQHCSQLLIMKEHVLVDTGQQHIKPTRVKHEHQTSCPICNTPITLAYAWTFTHKQWTPLLYKCQTCGYTIDMYDITDYSWVVTFQLYTSQPHIHHTVTSHLIR